MRNEARVPHHSPRNAWRLDAVVQYGAGRGDIYEAFIGGGGWRKKHGKVSMVSGPLWSKR